MELLDAVSACEARGWRMFSERWRVLWAVKVVVYVRGVGTVARGWGRTDGEYLFHCAVGEGLGGGRRGSWWRLVRHSAKVRKEVMSVR